MIDVGTLGGPNASLGFEGERSINNAGTVVVAADLSALTPDAFCLAPEAPSDCHVIQAALRPNSTAKLMPLGAIRPGFSSGPIWISDSGSVAGISQTGDIDPLTGVFELHAVTLQNGDARDLGTLGGNESLALGINNDENVVGCTDNGVSDPYSFCFVSAQQSRAFLWHDGRMQDLGTLGGPDAFAELINNRGDIAGWSLIDSRANRTTGIPTQHPFLWQRGKMRDLGSIGGTVVRLVNDLNENGQVVGSMTVSGDQSYHPFLWDGSRLRDLGTLGGNFGQANWISNSGRVVGWSTVTNRDLHAFLWNGAMHDLGTLQNDACSIAYGVNEKGQVVGQSANAFNCSAFPSRAFLWDKGELVDLNSLIEPQNDSVQLFQAAGINNNGSIAVQGLLSNGEFHAFLLIPTGRERFATTKASRLGTPGTMTITGWDRVPPWFKIRPHTYSTFP